MRIKKNMEQYPRLTELKIPIHAHPSGAGSYVEWKKVEKALSKKQLKKFHKFFGAQTCFAEGPYPYDVEAVLERIFSGRMTGTQLIPD